ncbi:CusA/CzcA family heavy metal efflux RND transporter [Ignavibacteria bacterium CHB1]|nr:MAG: CusA/CzcA family heavy metal efflux RND transporter [Chlorobiota bacterium]MBV6397666.1 Multidrug resistance protein MdtC [Ignavibacteria bacterium]MCC6885447.1 CusA/CzcA family heavy metal efflux RND transporter [Ignavibacteriales bacterium]MCE7952798.1 CusA/CzcA family heavy metal efflux RND transporter [Chlorobi bacterium CHB7]MDL1887034.1 CusA/CzcA family heavy metal efflux RND transporter [Ignavibacteria bacterium CHB1]RIK49560.1 MAG: CusA/CzcA family heavy metal efflux RND transp
MIDKVIAFSIKNKFVIALLTLALILWGLWSANKLQIDAVPDITNNQVQIITVCPTLATQEVEQLVTYPIEQSMANLPDLVELRSISRFGLSVITVVFDDNVDIYFARQLINEKLKDAGDKIPKGVGTPELAPVSTGLGEIYQYIIHPVSGSEDKYSAMELRTMQDWIVARQLYGTPGVAEVNSFGGQLKQYEVSINPDRLVAMGVSVPEIFTALERNNENTGSAYIDKKPSAYFIRGVGLIGSFDDIKNIVIKANPNGIPILIKDVAEVRFGSAVRYGAMTYNGEVDAVGGVVMMRKGANSSDVVNRIKEKMQTIQKSLPPDVKIEPYLDRTDLINRAIFTVQKNLIEGALIVIFVLVLFLGNLRAGLIVSSAIPLSMLFALGMMNLFGVSANLMSLGAIDFGLIVDGAVIIVEATMHHLGLRKSIGKLSQSEMDKEVYKSSSKIRSSAAFGEVIILIVYIPILTLIGIEGKMFRPMAQTVVFAISGALILSLTYIPMMCALFLPKQISQKETFSDKIMKIFQRIYSPLLEKAIKYKLSIVSVTVTIFAGTVMLFSKMGGEFIPTLQEGDFAIHCILPQGTSLSQSLETSMQVSRMLGEFDEVKMVIGKTGTAEVPTDPMPPEATDLMVILKQPDEWKRDISYDELADEMMQKLSTVPGVFFEKSQPIQMRFNELMTGIKQDVAVKIIGENMDTLLNYANKIKSVVQNVEGTTEPSVERITGLPQIVIKYNRSQIANYGLNIKDINHIISTAFAGGTAGVVFENERKFDLVVRLDSTHRNNIEDVSQLYIPTNNGTQIPLSQVAEIKMELGPAQISREDAKRRIVVGFNVKNRDVESVVDDIRNNLDKEIKLPEGYYYTFGGTFENLQAASKRLMIALPVALGLIFTLLYFTFGSFKQALLIYTAIPMSAIGGVFALVIRDMPFSISAGIGFIALFGVAVLNGIVLIGTFNQLEKDGVSDITKRIIEGTKTRLRPVLMTAAVASLGFLPMAISTSPGAEVQKPLATVVIGGLITATFLTLIVLPLLYMIFTKNRKVKVSPLVVLCFIIFTVGGVNAQSMKIINLDEAIKVALENNLKLQSKQLDLQSYQSMRGSSFELPKTNFNIQYGQYSSINNDLGFQISQTIPFPTYYFEKSKLLEAEMQNIELQRKALMNVITSQVKSQFYELQYLSAVKDRLKYLEVLYIDFVNAAGLRYKTGETNLLEKTTAETKYGEIQLLLKQNESDYLMTYNKLKTLMNTGEDFVIERIVEFQPLALNISFDTSLVSNNPALESMYKEVLIARQNKEIEIASLLPELNIGYFNQSLIGTQSVNGNEVHFGIGDRFHGVNLGINVPLTFFNSSSKIQSLDFKQQSLLREADNVRIQLQNQLRNAYVQYEQILSQYKYYSSTALLNSEVIINTAKVSFQSGEIDYIEFLQALETVTDVHLAYLNCINQLNQSVINITSLINK